MRRPRKKCQCAHEQADVTGASGDGVPGALESLDENEYRLVFIGFLKKCLPNSKDNLTFTDFFLLVSLLSTVQLD